MSRAKIAIKMINYLEKTINCQNIIKLADKMVETKSNKNKLIIKDIPVAFNIVPYNDDKNYSQKNSEEPKDTVWIQNKIKTFDIMTESNHSGFEYFPYLYGVLNCHDGDDSKLYIFYEFFAQNLANLINNLEHPSEWYDIIFQMIVIDYYLKTSGYDYTNATPENHLYKKLDKPYYREYILNNITFNINHKYLIVMGIWINIMEREESLNNESNISLLLDYVNKNKDKMKTPPSDRIVKLLTDIQSSPDNIPDILNRYYNPSSKSDKM